MAHGDGFPPQQTASDTLSRHTLPVTLFAPLAQLRTSSGTLTNLSIVQAANFNYRCSLSDGEVHSLATTLSETRTTTGEPSSDEQVISL